MSDMYKYPYQNYSLANMAGEIWLPIKDFEDLFMVSNLGRVKRLNSHIVYSREGKVVKRFLPERILLQNVRFRYNRHIEKTLCAGVSVILRRNTIKTHKHVSCLVYEAFIGTIPLNKIVQHQDEDSHNNRVENLYLSTWSQLTYKLKEEGRSNLLTVLIGTKHSPERVARHTLSRSMEVSQYDLDGNYIATYSSLTEAERQTKVLQTSISLVVNGTMYIAGGYVWRKEQQPWIDLSGLSELKKRRSQNRAKNCRAVSQYTIAGKLVANHKSVAEAARVAGLKAGTLYKYLTHKEVVQYDNYIWQFTDS